MKKTVLLVFLAFFAQLCFAQQDSLLLKQKLESLSEKLNLLEDGIKNNKNEIDKQNYDLLIEAKERKLDSLGIEVNKLESEINSNKLDIQKQTANIQFSVNKLTQNLNSLKEDQIKKDDNISALISENRNQIDNSTQKLGSKIELTDKKTQINITNLKDSLSQNTIFWMAGVLFVLILVILVFIVLKKSIKSNDSKLTDKIVSARKSLEEESIKLDGKLVDLLEKQLIIQKIEKPKASQNGSVKKADHSLALKVADEIIRIQKNLSRMDESVKGKKQLTASVKRIQSNFEANSYEIVDMLDKPFNDGMKVNANFKPDENLKSGEQIITRIIKPQVNFDGVMIQSAQIEVSQGE